MHIRAYISRSLINLFTSLFVSRRSKYVHLGLDIPLLSTRVSSELIEVIRNLEIESRDSKYYFVFPRTNTTKWKYNHISILRRKISNKASVKFINKSQKQVKWKITFRRCYGHVVLLVTIDLEGFELYQGRLFPVDW